MSLRDTYKTDAAKETEGVWETFGLNLKGEPIELHLSRISRTNTRYTKVLQREIRPHRAALNADAMDPALGDKVLQGVFVDTILLGWRGVLKYELSGDEADTDELPFTRENAMRLFDEMPDFYDDAEERAKSIATFRDKERDTVKGNS